MAELNELFVEQLAAVLMTLAVLIVVILVIVIVQAVKLRKVRRRYEAMMAGSGVEDLEGLLVDLRNQTDMLEEGHREQKAQLEAAQARIGGMKSKVAMKRYNAFGERGNDLSFSLAILDDNRSGIVLTSLHNRENAYLYSKPLEGGESKYPLTPEEKEVIALASQQT